MAFTYFFRDLHTIEQAVDHVLRTFTGCSRLKVWDAGCAMGQEPYTMAIVFAERMGKFAFKNLQIEATDLDGSDLFGPIISSGIYTEEELRRIPAELFERYFHPVSDRPGFFQLEDTIRARVRFTRRDLLSLEPPGSGFSLVLCKNVLLHLQHSERVEVISSFHRALLPGGFLAMEQTQKMPAECAHLFGQVVADAQLYRRSEEEA